MQTFILGKAYYGFEGVYWEYVFMHELFNIKYGVMQGSVAMRTWWCQLKRVIPYQKSLKVQKKIVGLGGRCDVCQWVDSEGRLPDSDKALITSSQPTPLRCSVCPVVSSTSCLEAHAIPLPPRQRTHHHSLCSKSSTAVVRWTPSLTPLSLQVIHLLFQWPVVQMMESFPPTSFQSSQMCPGNSQFQLKSSLVKPYFKDKWYFPAVREHV